MLKIQLDCKIVREKSETFSLNKYHCVPVYDIAVPIFNDDFNM